MNTQRRNGIARTLRVARLLILAGLPLLSGCVGHYETVTKQVNLQTLIHIRENGAFNDFSQVDLSDMVKAKDDIGTDAEILSMTITALSADITALSTTTADALTFALAIRDASGTVAPITENSTIGDETGLAPGVNVKNVINLFPKAAQSAAIGSLQGQLNAFLKSNANVTLLVGFSGSTSGGRVDADMHANVTLSVTFRKCVSGPAGGFVSTSAESCLA